MNQSTNSVSIIMPVKNAGSYLHDCLSSIRGQTFSFWQLIAINDHSTDDSLNILRSAAQADDRIQVFQNDGKGIVPAFFQAIKHCTGRYITRMDADDLMPDRKLELMVTALQEAPAKSIVTGKVKYFGEGAISPGYLKYEAWLNERTDREDHWRWVYRECVIASPNWMMRRAELMDMADLDQLLYPEDYHLVLKWYQQGFQVISLPETTLMWREHPDRTSRNSEHYNQDHFFKLKILHFINHQLDFKPLVLWGTGPKGKLTAKLLDENSIPFQWMDLLPGAEQKKVGNHTISDFQNIENIANCKLLISVFPPGQERFKLETYLGGLGMKMGHDYWYL